MSWTVLDAPGGGATPVPEPEGGPALAPELQIPPDLRGAVRFAAGYDYKALRRGKERGGDGSRENADREA